MLFWILAALLATFVILVVVNECDGYGEPVMAGVATSVIGGVVGVMIWGACCWLMPRETVVTSQTTHQLRALGNDSALQGRSYFLGGGYINDKRVLNYITRSDSGAIKVEQADASDSTIYEGSSAATATVSEIDGVNGWISPWPIDHKHAYEFHIPAGSVVESYALDNK